MASAGGVRAGKAFVEAYLDATALERGLNQALGKMKAFAAGLRQVGKSMAVAGSAIIAPLLFGARALMKMSDEIEDVQNNTDLSVEAIQRMTIGSEELGVAAETTAGALATMGTVIGRAMDGNKKAIKTIDDLGLSLDGLKKASPDQRMRLVFDALRNIEDPALRLARGSRILGRGFREMGDIFKMSGQDFDALTDKLEKGGLFLSKADVQAGKDLTKAWTEIRTAVVKLAAVLAAVFTPAMIAVMNKAVNIVVNFKEWSKENKGLIAVVLALGAGLLVLGTALAAIGALLGGVVAVFGALVPLVFQFWKLVVGGLGVKQFVAACMHFGPVLQEFLFEISGSVMHLTRSFGWLGLAVEDMAGGFRIFLNASPTLAWFAAWKGLDFLNNQFLKFSNNLQTFADGIKASFAGVGEDVSKSLSLIGEAVSMGELGLAFKIAWVGIKLAVLEIIAGIPKALLGILPNLGTRIIDWASMVITTGIEVLSLLPKAMAYAWYAMARAFEWAAGKLSQLKEVAANKLAEIWVLASTLAAGGTMEEAGQKLLMLDEMHNAEMAAITAETEARMKGVNLERDAALQQIEDLKNASIAAVDNYMVAWQEGVMKLNKVLSDYLNDKMGINELRDELGQLELDLEYLKWLKEHAPSARMADVKLPVPEAVKPVDLQARGQFGGWSTLGMQAMGPMDKLTKAAQETADNTAYIADNMGDGGLAVE
jgi:hypothetical protein